MLDLGGYAKSAAVKTLSPRRFVRTSPASNHLYKENAMEHLTFAQIGVAPLNLLKRFAKNLHGRDFIVGDLRGCRAMFDHLLLDVGFDKASDRMFCTGGLINYGPDSVGCLDLIKEPWFHSVAGESERQLLSAAVDPSFNWKMFVAKGGTWATMLDAAQLLDLADQVADLPLAIVVGDGNERFNVIHAEFHGPDEALEDALEQIDTSYSVPRSLTNGRDLIAGKVLPQEHEGLSTTFCGHTPVDSVAKIGSHVYIETGAYLAERSGNYAAHSMTVVEPETALHWRARARAKAS